MKNTNKLFLSFLGLTVVLTSCQEQPEKETPAAIAAEAEQVIYETPKQIISLEEADSLYVNYEDRRATNIVEMEAKYQEDEKPFVPTQFVSFDIETIKEYINYAEQEAKTGGTSIDSLRIYLGNYGNKKGVDNRHNTVFFVPAAKVKSGFGGIYIAEDGQAKLISDYFKGEEEETVNSGTSLILNFGNCCPPKNGDF